jgi:uncharacterized protein YgiM (DUF1202 family)
MKIKPIFYTFFLLCVLIINTTTNADNSSSTNNEIINRKKFCRQYFIYYGLNINIRSQAGWQRVIKNNKLPLYTNDNFQFVSNKNKNILEQCIINPDYNNRQNFDRGDQQ